MLKKTLIAHLVLLVVLFFSLSTLAQDNLAREPFSRPPFTLIFQQETEHFRGLLIFYPGGRVDPEAYFWFGEKMAEHDFLVAVVDFPFNLGVLAPNRARAVHRFLLNEGWSWEGQPIIGGHSLGGAMAARFADNNPVGGLFLWAAYPPFWTDLTEAVFPVLVLMAENDGLATTKDVEKGITQLPVQTRVHLIQGGIHSFFGRYGLQRGDGEPEITREEQEKKIFEVMIEFFKDKF